MAAGNRLPAGGGSLSTVGERKLNHVTAQPTEDAADPLVILRDLPEREHEEFLRQYHRAVDAAHNPAGYQQLRRLLHVWSLTAIAAQQPGYYEELGAARAGTAMTVPVTDAIPMAPASLSSSTSPGLASSSGPRYLARQHGQVPCSE